MPHWPRPLRRPFRPLSLAAALLVTVALVQGGTEAPAAARPQARPCITDPKPSIRPDETVGAMSPGLAGRVIRRLLPCRQASQIVFAKAGASPGRDGFTISGSHAKVRISADTTSAALAGADWYLKYVLKVQVSRHARPDLSRLPARLPVPRRPISRSTQIVNRYMYNFTSAGYSMPYWNLDQWADELDYVAVAGYDQALELIGQDYVWYRFLLRFGYTDEQARSWISQPAHQPWQWMSNMSGFKGPIAKDLLDKRLALGRQIVALMRERGITPVFPGFAGTVPADFDRHVPQARLVQQGGWEGFERPAWLDPTSEAWGTAARTWYDVQTELFGPTSHYAMDLFHEGGKNGDVPVRTAYRLVQEALESAHPGATWMLQGWTGTPKAGFSADLDTSKVLVLDLNSDGDAKYSAGYEGVQWAFGSINNWGGRGYVFGRLFSMATSMPAALASGQGRQMTGIASVMEDTQANDADADLLADLAWRTEPVDLRSWLSDYGVRRYQSDTPDVRAAWEGLAHSAYSLAGERFYPGHGGPDAMFEARPSWSSTGAITYRPKKLYWDPGILDAAWRHLVSASDRDPRLRSDDAYRKDLVDVGAQLLSDRSRYDFTQAKAIAAKPVSDSYPADRKLADFGAAAQTFLDHLRLADELLGTRRDSMLGTLIVEARSWAGSPAEADVLEYDIRSIVSTWGDTAQRAADLHDYSARHLNGLYSTLYTQRWTTFFDAVKNAIRTGADLPDIDFYGMEAAWTTSTDKAHIPAAPSGDTVEVSRRIAKAITPVDLTHGQRISISKIPAKVTQGAPFKVAVSITNTGTERLSSLAPQLELPDGWAVVNAGVAFPAAIDPGATATATYTVMPARHTPIGTATVTARMQWVPGDTATNPTFVGTPTAYTSAHVRVGPWVKTPGVDTPFASIADAFSAVAFSDDTNPSAGDMDLKGNSYSAQALAAAGFTVGGKVSALDTTFDVGRAGSPDAVPADGSWFNVNEEGRKGSKLAFLGATASPSASGTVTVTYTDGTTATGTLGFPNWAQASIPDNPAFGAKVVVDSRYRNVPTGPANQGFHYVVWGNTIDIDPARTVASVRMPVTANGELRVFAVAVVPAS
ncbi:hypothetical protein GCM10023191_016910 [Actinoallomurus oryzae]|uniref:Alpha-N-acetylglucosaminidase n=1 Tax=Actinoallomurus oryzae TaxID=502180 RepID=A0ABP8PLU0_9ACTN